SYITSKHAEQGIVPPGAPNFDEEETKEIIKAFLKDFLPRVVSDPGQGSDSSLTEKKNLGL
ncbi:hypothetical protein OAF06_05335, partial [Akkermansiaceae bacterium]|nr:hypothetical protein [Akkermansiaceae bacterium]